MIIHMCCWLTSNSEESNLVISWLRSLARPWVSLTASACMFILTAASLPAAAVLPEDFALLTFPGFFLELLVSTLFSFDLTAVVLASGCSLSSPEQLLPPLPPPSAVAASSSGSTAAAASALASSSRSLLPTPALISELSDVSSSEIVILYPPVNNNKS